MIGVDSDADLESGPGSVAPPFVVPSDGEFGSDVGKDGSWVDSVTANSERPDVSAVTVTVVSIVSVIGVSSWILVSIAESYRSTRSSEVSLTAPESTPYSRIADVFRSVSWSVISTVASGVPVSDAMSVGGAKCSVTVTGPVADSFVSVSVRSVVFSKETSTPEGSGSRRIHRQSPSVRR